MVKNNSPYISRQNTLLVTQSSQAIHSHIERLRNPDIARRISIVCVDCNNCLGSQYDYPAVCLFDQIFKEIQKRTQIKWFNLLDWFRFGRSNRFFKQVIQEFTVHTTTDDLFTILANNHSIITSQISRLVEKEQKEFALLIVSNFETIQQKEQPVIASLLHRVVKGNLAYFRIIATQEPTLFNKTASGEVGIQINNDYIEIQE